MCPPVPCLSLAPWPPPLVQERRLSLQSGCVCHMASLLSMDLFRSKKETKEYSIIAPGCSKRKEKESNRSSMIVLFARY